VTPMMTFDKAIEGAVMFALNQGEFVHVHRDY
jgi:hypothetical protein